mmetsp:Transcript_12606/g.31759  ORF Transcript_12606/g.31759 Transcript_12606/m.31759 type:complete len:261 (+) Transcript_12606:313-1095(+)
MAIMNVATLSWLLVLSFEITQPCEAFVPSTRTTSASMTSSSYSNTNTLLSVASSPPPSKESTAEDEDENIPKPLFTLDSVVQEEGQTYQVEDAEELPPPMSDLPLPGQKASLPTLEFNASMPASEFISEPTDNEDLSFYYRDEDDMLTEREDRLYTDENGIRRVVERCILVGVEDLAAQRKARKSELYYDPLDDDAEAPLFFSRGKYDRNEGTDTDGWIESRGGDHPTTKGSQPKDVYWIGKDRRGQSTHGRTRVLHNCL